MHQRFWLFQCLKVPIYEQRNDGRDNLLGALVIAGHYVIPEVSRAGLFPEMIRLVCLLVVIIS